MTQLPQASRLDEKETRLDPKVVELVERLSETSPLSVQIEALTKGIGLRSRELTAVAKISRATLSRLRRADGAERPAQLDDLRAIAGYMVGTGALRPRSVGGWLRSRNKGLSLQRPLDVLADGEFALVLSAAEAACGGRLPVKREPQAVTDAGRTVFSAIGVDVGPEPPPDPDLTGSPTR